MKKLVASMMAFILMVGAVPARIYAETPKFNHEIQVDSVSEAESANPGYDFEISKNEMVANPVAVSPDEVPEPEETTVLNEDTGYKIDDSNLVFNTSSTDPEARYEVIVELMDEPLGDEVTILNERNAEQATAQDLRELKQRADLLMAKQAQTIEAAKSLDEDVEILYNYTTVFNGFSAKLSYEAIEGLRNNPLVKDIYLSETYEVPTTPSDISATKMVSANYAWSNGYDGEGKLIAIVDTGVKYTHPLLNNLDAPGKITKADFVARVGSVENTVGLAAGTDSRAQYYFNDKVIFGYDYIDLDRNPMDDVVGHGTHVAGISAANNTEEGLVIGMAPKAQLMAMKVFSSFYPYGSSDAAILAGVEDAYKLGADSINLSLGAACGYDTYPKGLGKFNLEKVYIACKEGGTLVASASGNDRFIGEKSAFASQLPAAMPYASNPEYGTVGSPGTFESSFTVASADNANVTFYYFMWNGEKTLYVDTGTVYPANKVFNGQTLDFINVPGYGTPADYTGLDVNGKVVVVSRGGPAPYNEFRYKAIYASMYGARGIIIRNDVEGVLRAGVDASVTIPLISVDKETGERLAAAGSGQISFGLDYITMVPVGDTYISSFSSRGVTPGLKIKPDITGIGGNIYSTYIDDTGYISMGGTSMATPQIAGAAVLIRQYVEEEFPNLTRSEQSQLVENLMMSASRPMKDEYGNYYSVQTQGSGVLDVKGAMDTDAILYDAKHRTKLELGDNLTQTVKFDFYVENLTDRLQQYYLSGVIMADTPFVIANGEDPTDFLTYNTTLQSVITDNAKFTGTNVSTDLVSVSANSKVKVTVTFRIPNDVYDEIHSYFANGFFLNGFVFAKPVSGAYELSIPFLGYSGDWNAAPIFDTKTAYDPIYKVSEMPFYRQDLLFGVSGYLGYNTATSSVYGPQYVSMSPNGDNALDKVVPILALLRNAHGMYAEVLDSNGNLVKKLTASITDAWSPKAFVGNGNLYATMPGSLQWDGTDTNGQIVPQGQYIYRLTAYTYENVAQTREYPIYIDLQAPTFTTRVYQEDGKWLLEYNVHDSHYLKSVSISAAGTPGMAIQSPNVSDYSTVLDVTATYNAYGENMLRYIVVRASDYADNAYTYRLQAEDTSGEAPSISGLEWNKYSAEGVPGEAYVCFFSGTNMTPDTKITGTLYTAVSGKYVPVPGVENIQLKYGRENPNFFHIPYIPVTSNQRLLWEFKVEGGTRVRQEVFTTSKWSKSMWENQTVLADDEGRVGFRTEKLRMPDNTHYARYADYMGKTYEFHVSPHGFKYIDAQYVPGETLIVKSLKYADTFYEYTSDIKLVLPELGAPAPTPVNVPTVEKTVDFKISQTHPTLIDPDNDGIYYVDYVVRVGNASNCYLFNFRVSVDSDKLALAEYLPYDDNVTTVGAYKSSMHDYYGNKSGYDILVVTKPSSPITTDEETRLVRLRFAVLDKNITAADLNLHFTFALDTNNARMGATAAGRESVTESGSIGHISILNSVSVDVASGTEMLIGTTLAAHVTTDPVDALNKGRVVDWKSSNNDVATVDSNGVITAVGYGTTTISVGFIDQYWGWFVRTFDIKVVAPKANSVKINGPALASLKKGNTLQLTATVLPERALEDPNTTLVWTSSNPNIAYVDPSTGLVTGKAAGTVVITCTVTTATSVLKANVSVKVTN